MKKFSEVRVILESEEIVAIKKAYEILKEVWLNSEDESCSLNMYNVEDAVKSLHRIIEDDDFEWATYK